MVTIIYCRRELARLPVAPRALRSLDSTSTPKCMLGPFLPLDRARLSQQK
jgi:hypothetical protein